MTPSFPLIQELPLRLDTANWEWRRPLADEQLHQEHWIGRAPDGTQWLVKMSGSAYAWRERTFARLAQELNLSCQSSVYLILQPDAEPLRHDPTREPHQLAIVFLQRHAQVACNQTCPIQSLYSRLNQDEDAAKIVVESGVRHAASWLQGEVLGYFCGANEIGEELITVNHELVLIDNEQAFSSLPAPLDSCRWIYPTEGKQSDVGFDLALELAERLANIPDEPLRSFAKLPNGFPIARLDLPARLIAARHAARHMTRRIGS